LEVPDFKEILCCEWVLGLEVRLGNKAPQ